MIGLVLATLGILILFPAGCALPGSGESTTQSESMFHGVSLEGVPRTTNFTELPDLFHESPPGSGSYTLREQVAQVYRQIDGTVYHIPDKNRFYVQHDPVGSGVMTIYGPCAGNPAVRLADMKK